MLFKIFKILKYVFDILLIAVFLWISFNTSLVIYGIGQAEGQLHLVLNARPFEEVLADPVIADSVKAKLAYIERIKRFAIDSLGLKSTENYTTYFDQRGIPVLWVLTASEKFSLKAYEWRFPLLGNVSYKGYFDYRKGLKEEQALKALNYDTDLDDVSAWSTLGWFRDPVLSGMLNRDAGSLAELIIHEMTHGTIYLESSVSFNENFANMIGEEGALRFLLFTEGINSENLKIYRSKKNDYDLFSRYMIASAARLDSLYVNLKSSDAVWEKEKLKANLMESIVKGMDTIHFENRNRYSGIFMHRLPNNAYFLSFRRYDEKKDSLKNELYRNFGGDIKAYITFLQEQKK